MVRSESNYVKRVLQINVYYRARASLPYTRLGSPHKVRYGTVP